MITLEQIRKDLREIRYYYANEKAFQSMAKSVGESSVVEKVGRYNGIIRKAPAKLYALYSSLYVNNNTQLTVSFDWDCTEEYVKRLNKKLYLFIQKELQREVE